MIILSNGYKLPEIGDFGDVWFPALEDNIQRTNDHNHDGTNSNKIPSTSLTALVQAVASGDFAVDGDRFSATISLAGGAGNIDEKTVVLRDPTTKNPLHMDIEKIGLSQIKIYTEIARDVEVVVV